MTPLKVALAAVIAISTSVSANALTVTAQWNPVPTFVQSGGATEQVNDVVSLVVADKAGGGVDVTITNTGSFDNIGSVFFLGFAADQFTGPGFIFDASTPNKFASELGGSGVVFGNITQAGNYVTRYETAAGSTLKASDFLGDTVGTITYQPQSFALSLFSGTLVRDLTAVPIPAGGLLLLSGLLGIAGLKRRKA